MPKTTTLSRDILRKICLGGWPRDQQLESIIDDFIDVARKLTESEYGSLFLLQREEGDVRVVSGSEEGELLADLPNLLELDKESPGIITWVYQNNQPYLTNDVRDDPYYFPVHKGVQSNLVVPIRLQGEAIGVLSVESTERGHYTPDQQRRLEDLADAVSLVISRHWLTEYSRRRGYDVEIVGISEGIRRIEALVKRVAPTREPVLLMGESGVGKELLAHAIHYFSERRDKELLIVNCGAFAEELLASELFGHVRGAFTGAHRDKAGKMELADGGTLFLDEVESMSPRLQVMLLRALEHGEVQKVGEDRAARRVDARIIAASNEDLGERVRQGTFREDLYYRLNVFTIRVPPLRERREDVPLLAEHFLHSFERNNPRAPDGITDAALEALARYDWPGNVRELRNAVRRAAVLATNDMIDVADLPPEIARGEGAAGPEGGAALASPEAAGTAPEGFEAGDGDGGPDGPGAGEARSLDAVIEDHLRRVLEAVEGNKTRAAEILDIPRTSLYHKLRKYGIEATEGSS